MKNIRIVGEKILGWNIAVKNSRLLNSRRIFSRKMWKKSEIGEIFQDKKLLWKILVGRSVEKTVIVGEKF